MKKADFIHISLVTFALFFIALPVFAEEIDFTFTSTFDSSQQKAAGYVPKTGSNQAMPLLVYAHYFGGYRLTAKYEGYYAECEKRGWLLVCPELHGHRSSPQTSFASLEAQHDIIDAINYMKGRYKVDNSRIYICGKSMGGMLTQIMAAKYPDLFAAAVAGQGISDLHTWVLESPGFQKPVEYECGNFCDSTEFTYARRSSVNYASNLANFPLYLWHGTNDFLVPSSQSELLHKSIQKYTSLTPDIFWLYGAPHSGITTMVQWEFNQLGLNKNICESGQDLPGKFFSSFSIATDEDKPFYWVSLKRKNQSAFGHVTASIRNDTAVVNVKNIQTIEIVASKLAKGVSCASYTIASDGETDLICRGTKIHIVKNGSGALPASQ